MKNEGRRMENSKNGILHDVQDDRYFIFNFP